ncbi:sugar phosphate isomerase/epimerase family protein [Nakamurella sp. GG22]
MMRLCCQEQHLPGATLEEKFAAAVEYGFDGIELRGAGDLAFEARLPELQRARANGVVMPTVCVDMLHFIGAFDDDLRADAIAQMTSQLTVMAEIGGTGAMTPAAYGMFSRRLPPFEPPRSAADDRVILLDALGRLGEHARSVGVKIFLEPLNRYEDHMVNRLSEGISLIEEIGLDSVQLAADTYHQNIEEADPAASLRAAAPHLGHVQVSDSNRLEPGAGHLDWPLFAATLRDVGYSGDIALESRLSGPADEVLPRVPGFLRRYL